MSKKEFIRILNNPTFRIMLFTIMVALFGTFLILSLPSILW